MIEIKKVSKKFDKLLALDKIELDIQKGTVLGLVGSNGSGKSTLLRILSGVYEPDGGEVLVEGKRLFDNPYAKGECYFVPDFPYFYNNSTINNTAFLYKRLYPNWSDSEFERLCAAFPIQRNARIINMSKGMQRQAALILALSTCPKYLFLDEIFDGLDPVVRQLLKRLIIHCVADKEMTVVIASHNLRELEDLCDRVCLMHKGKILLEREIDALKLNLRKVQIAFSNVPEGENILEGIQVLNVFRNGNIFNLTIRGTEEEFMPKLQALNPLYISAMPLTLEEIFICEMGAAGYDASGIV